ncbi:MAG: hypothetical protein DRO23_09430 [Thermoprotei archaeon]|nr:MAG: hypothetical protein DRO23_09430 [Thermoprotei archaeon]
MLELEELVELEVELEVLELVELVVVVATPPSLLAASVVSIPLALVSIALTSCESLIVVVNCPDIIARVAVNELLNIESAPVYDAPVIYV